MKNQIEQHNQSRNFEQECTFSTSRSSGAGGQHVNKVETKVELRFNIDDSNLLTDEEKELLKKNLKNRIVQDCILQITSQTDRSQHRNKENCIELFYELLEIGLKKPKKRIKRRITKAMKERRLERKRQHSDKKKRRRNIDVDS